MAILGDHRIRGVDAALVDPPTRVGVHVADHAPILRVADVPELAVGQAVELDAAGKAVGVEVVKVYDPSYGSSITTSIAQQERSRLAGAMSSASQLGDHRLPLAAAYA